jgi:hypothetical protein
MGDNILKNPFLTGHSAPDVVVDHQGKQQYVEHPTNWTFTYAGGLNDGTNFIPQSLHRDRGYVIAAGWRRWEGGYSQDVKLTKGKRYVAKAVFNADVNVAHRDKLIEWRFTAIRNGKVEAASAWSTGTYGREMDHLFVVEARKDVIVNLGFFARSPWADNAVDFNVYAITLEEVAADYGGDQVSYIGTAGDSQPLPEPPTPEPTEPETPTPVPVDQGWVKALKPEFQARVMLGRLILSHGEFLRPVLGRDEDAYELIGLLAEMLDAKTSA